MFISRPIIIAAARNYRRKHALLGMVFSTGTITRTGTVKSYNASKAYGFVNADGEDNVDIFLHKTAIPFGDKQKYLNLLIYPGRRILFEVDENSGRPRAKNVRNEDGTDFSSVR